MTKNDYASDFSSISWLGDKDWAIKPVQDRSKKTLQKILATSRELFINNSFEDTTLAQISSKSGVSIGSIYNLFNDKSAIFRTLYEHYRLVRVGQIKGMIERHNWPEQQALDIVKFHIEIIFSSSRTDGSFLRLVERQRVVDQLLYEIQAQSEEDFCIAMLKLYNARKEDFAHPDLETAVRYMHYIVRGSALWSIMPTSTEHQFLDISDKNYQRETIRMACAYLGVAAA